MVQYRTVRLILLIAILPYFFNTPSAFAQVARLKTSYSALTVNMAAYWLAGGNPNPARLDG